MIGRLSLLENLQHVLHFPRPCHSMEMDVIWHWHLSSGDLLCGESSDSVIICGLIITVRWSFSCAAEAEMLLGVL